MNQSLPKFHDTYIHILECLKDGKPMHYNELRKAVRDQYYTHLPEDLLKQKTKSGDILILNRIGWGKAYLKQAKMVYYPERGMVQITPKGLEVLKKGSLTHKELRHDPDYVAHEEKKKAEKSEEAEVNIENATPQDMIDFGVSSIEKEVKTELLEKLKCTDPYYFEKVVLKLLHAMGYGDFQETAKSGDGGIDGIINQDKLGLEKIYVQAKRYAENKVRETDIRNFIGAMSGDTSKGIFVTTSCFDEGAKKKAKDAHHKIIFIDGETLVELMYEYGVGVQAKDTYVLKELDEDFFIE
jgi:restriction system protein